MTLSPYLVQPYDCNKRFTIRALKKLERAANIPLLSDQAVEQKLREIKTCVGFKVQTHHDASTSSFLQYMHSWLSSTQCATEPTWSSLLDALRSVNLMEQAKQIEDCLKTARVVVEPKTKEGTMYYTNTLLSALVLSC